MDPCGPEQFWTPERRAELTASIRSVKLSWTDRTAEITGAEMDRIAAERAGMCESMVAQKAPEEAQEKVGLCLRASLLRQWALYEALKAPSVAKLVNLDHVLADITDGMRTCQKDVVWRSYDARLPDAGQFKAQELTAVAWVYRKLEDERAEEATALALAAAEASGSKALKIAALLNAANYAASSTDRSHPQAQALASQALALAKAEGWRSYQAVAEAVLAQVALRQENYAEAERLAVNALRVTEEIYGVESLESALMLDALGDVHQHQGEFAKAVSHHQRALAMCRKLAAPQHPCLVNLAFRVAATLDKRGNHDEALQHYGEILTIFQSQLGATHPHSAIVHAFVGISYFRREDYTKAREHYDQALALAANAAGMEHPYATFAHSRLGELHQYLGDWGQALKHYEAALSALIEAIGPEHEDVASAHLNVASVQFKLEDYLNASHHQVKALTILIEIRGSEHLEVAYAHTELGNTLGKAGHPDKALPHHQRALAIRLKALGAEHPGTAESRAKVGVALFHTGQRAEGIASLKEALATRMQVLGAEHPDTLGNHSALGSIYHLDEQHALALEHYRHVLITFRKIAPDEREAQEFFLQRIQQVCDAGHAPACDVR
ncbi:MAG: tetratricopeptide repeat protein [Polyangiaceae bacterium]|nr:tetratricopeptide repeat protein [Polyangiaceae bacterium]